MTQAKVIHGKKRDIGGFTVLRSLPTVEKRSLGPFVFLDHMGPSLINAEKALDVRPHPHIGLATVTYLFEGRGFHRDTLGSAQMITPGDLNWMTAGRGIAHSERSPSEEREHGSVMHGVQIWVGLPREMEECEPEFVHWPKESFSSLPLGGSLTARLLLGEFQGLQSPVKLHWRTLFVDLMAAPGTLAEFDVNEKEFGLFVVEGECEVNGTRLVTDDLLIVEEPGRLHLRSESGFRAVLIGGDPFPEPRHMWWNFVSTRKERIRQAAQDWKDGKFGQVPGENDFIPLPETPLP